MGENKWESTLKQSKEKNIKSAALCTIFGFLYHSKTHLERPGGRRTAGRLTVDVGSVFGQRCGQRQVDHNQQNYRTGMAVEMVCASVLTGILDFVLMKNPVLKDVN